VGATLGAALVVLGDRPELYKAMADVGPLSSAELAERTATAERYVSSSLDADGTWLIVEPFAADNVQDNLNPAGRVYCAASTLICEARLQEVVATGGFSRFRRAAETPFNLILEARP
jgi:hypothetical protein